MILTNDYLSIKNTNTLRSVDLNGTKSVARISSGVRINGAADDAAGLALSEKLTTQVNGTSVAKRNIMDGVSLIDTAESALSEVHDMLGRVYELSIQQGNETLTEEDKALLLEEVSQIKSEIDYLAQMSFNGIEVFSGDKITLQVGANTDDTYDVYLDNISHISKHLITKGSSPEITSPEKIKTLIDRVSLSRAEMGAASNALTHKLDSLTSANTSYTEAASRITDSDVAKEMANLLRNQVKSQSGVMIASQINNNKSSFLQLLK